jgi:adenylosuccinate synthase
MKNMQKGAVIVTDVLFGDGGKGSTTDWLVRQADSAVVIRNVGGAQAAHNVITPDGRHHTFSQFGSGSFIPETKTHLGPKMIINPINMFPEADHLISLGVSDIWNRLSVDRDALVITPWQRAANRLREFSRGSNRHGSCGVGIGETVSDSINNSDLVVRVRDLASPWLHDKLERLRLHKYDQLVSELGSFNSWSIDPEWQLFLDTKLSGQLCMIYKRWVSLVKIVDSEYVRQLADQNDLLVFEGAQGVLLDEWYGFHPYTTWSNTTPNNAFEMLNEIGYDESVTSLGVMRAYATRHGAGPFPTEDQALANKLVELHNSTGKWQGDFRFGHLDILMLKYAIAACGNLDGLVVTGLDQLSKLPSWHVSDQYLSTRQSTDLEKFFDLSIDGTIIGIKLNPQEDVESRSQLTKLLFSCSPVYQSVSALNDIRNQNDHLGDYLRVIEDSLGLQIKVTSFGPTAADKQALIAI